MSLSATPDIVIIGLTITSSWGNGHATTYRGLVKELIARGHNVLFLEKDVPWYRMNRDYTQVNYGSIGLYSSFEELQLKFCHAVRNAEVVIVGSYVPDGKIIGEWVTETALGITAFYDIDTPVTLAHLKQGTCSYISPELIPKYTMYLSFTGGRVPDFIEKKYGARYARPLYCSVDPEIYFPEKGITQYDLGYMGTYCDDRQASLEELLIKPACKYNEGKFIIAGPLYPPEIRWPANIRHTDHISPAHHRVFYCSQRFTLNLTRADMKKTGYSPSVRLFEAAACGTPVISDYWEGLDELFTLNEEVLISSSTEQTLHYIQETTDRERMAIGLKARNKIITHHTAAHRARELDSYIYEVQHRRNVVFSLNVVSKAAVFMEV